MNQFFFGASLSAHQVEGNNIYSDWWEFEQKVLKPKGIDVSGDGTRHWDLYEEDFKLAQRLGHNAHRLSLEWAKIEPEEGKIDYEVINHYKHVLKYLINHGITPIVTLWHFTLPKWFADKGGFAKKDNLRDFVNYCKFIGTEFRYLLKFIITINEPIIYSYNSYMDGVWPPQQKSYWKTMKIINHLILAHKRSYHALKGINPEYMVGIAKNNQVFRLERKKNVLDLGMMKYINYIWNHRYLDKCKQHLDFIGLNYYFYHCVKVDTNLVNNFYQFSYPTTRRTDMNWEVYPKGLYITTQNLAKRYKLPIIITENGVADRNDKLRTDFIKEGLYWIFKSRADGADIFGYLHWALTDNFEWAFGYKPRFGLIEVEYKDYNRTIRPSALVYQELIKKYQKQIADESAGNKK